MGRIFRKMGLPPWALIGIAVSTICLNYLGTVLELVILWLLGEECTLSRWLPPVIVLLLPIVGVLGLAAALRFGQEAARRRQIGGQPQQPEGKRGLILLVSRAEHALYAFQHHAREKKLQRVWLIYTGEAERERFGPGSRSQAEKIKAECKRLCEYPIEVELFREVSPSDSQDTFEAVNRIYRTSGLEPGEVIADFTGGTKPMTVGMIMACLPADRELEYVSYNREKDSMFGPYLVDYQHTAFNLVG
jgi:hypothetical protein